MHAPALLSASTRIRRREMGKTTNLSNGGKGTAHYARGIVGRSRVDVEVTCKATTADARQQRGAVRKENEREEHTFLLNELSPEPITHDQSSKEARGCF